MQELQGEPRDVAPRALPVLVHDFEILAPKDDAGPVADPLAVGRRAAAVAGPEAEPAAIDVPVAGVPAQSAALSSAVQAAAPVWPLVILEALPGLPVSVEE